MTTLEQLQELRNENEVLQASILSNETEQAMLLRKYATEMRVFPDGVAVHYEGRDVVVAGVMAYPANREQTELALCYGLNSQKGEPIASIREDNLAKLVNA